jgi:hypothetical protein
VTDSKLVDIILHLHHETTAAFLVSDTGEDEDAVWLPKSQVEQAEETASQCYVFVVPEWLAMKKGLL